MPLSLAKSSRASLMISRCASGVVGSMSCGIVLSSLMWRYLSIANCAGSWPEPWDRSVSCFKPFSCRVGPVDLDQCAHILSELLPSHERYDSPPSSTLTGARRAYVGG